MYYYILYTSKLYTSFTCDSIYIYIYIYIYMCVCTSLYISISISILLHLFFTISSIFPLLPPFFHLPSPPFCIPHAPFSRLSSLLPLLYVPFSSAPCLFLLWCTPFILLFFLHPVVVPSPPSPLSLLSFMCGVHVLQLPLLLLHIVFPLHDQPWCHHYTAVVL